MSGAQSAGDHASTGNSQTLSVRPFRGVRYAPGLVADPATVTSPPYDVVDAEGVAALEAADPHNVVRLILPRDDASGPGGRYRHAADTLERWLADGVLVRDDAAALYAYEQARDGEVLQRGLLGAVVLHPPEDRVVLPHEDVMPGPVTDRLELMRAARANVEPILLVYDGGGVTRDVLDRVAATAALVTARTTDGLTHRVWRLADPADHDRIGADLSHRQALIADGHHRYAAYRALQAEQDRLVPGGGPWDAGLALLVDLRAHPLHLAAIHRSVAGVPAAVAAQLAEPLFRAVPVDGDPATVAARLRSGRIALAQPEGPVLELEVADPQAVDQLLPRDRPAAWRALDTAVLHHALLPRWGAAEGDVGYHHDVAGALRAAGRTGGTAVLLPPVRVEEVLDLAAQGQTMPRKSTSFGPKPRTGLVLRTLAED